MARQDANPLVRHQYGTIPYEFPKNGLLPTYSGFNGWIYSHQAMSDTAAAIIHAAVGLSIVAAILAAVLLKAGVSKKTLGVE